MFIRLAIVTVLSGTILGGVWLASAGTPPKKTTSSSSPAADANKPADSTPEPEADKPRENKPITLAQAINLVEKGGRGDLVKAEAVGTGDKVQFNIEVLAKDGSKIRTTVNAAGAVVSENVEPARTVSTTPKKGKNR
jgi:hypothetical protein